MYGLVSKFVFLVVLFCIFALQFHFIRKNLYIITYLCIILNVLLFILDILISILIKNPNKLVCICVYTYNFIFFIQKMCD